jgi:hypothetical protein
MLFTDFSHYHIITNRIMGVEQANLSDFIYLRSLAFNTVQVVKLLLLLTVSKNNRRLKPIDSVAFINNLKNLTTVQYTVFCIAILSRLKGVTRARKKKNISLVL